MDFSKINGYEFEDFIANLFRNKGFKVTQTDYSCDGGIDLIAEYDKPIFSGKYIIQCKKYTDNLVGQPEIRDLYGVVMSENANKGILITTSDFTEQARSFAKGKNIELINGNILNSIVDSSEEIKLTKSTLKFYEISGFDRQQYELLKKRVKNSKRNNTRYEELLQFLYTYVVSCNEDMLNGGILEEMIEINNERMVWVDKFTQEDWRRIEVLHTCLSEILEKCKKNLYKLRILESKINKIRKEMDWAITNNDKPAIVGGLYLDLCDVESEIEEIRELNKNICEIADEYI